MVDHMQCFGNKTEKWFMCVDFGSRVCVCFISAVQTEMPLLSVGALVPEAGLGGGHPQNDNDDECWLCAYQNDDETKRLMEFVVKAVGYIDTKNIATQVSMFIHERFGEAVDAHGNQTEIRGAEPSHVEIHITRHVLHPKIRISLIIQDLLNFQEHLHRNLVLEDVSTGLTAVDKGNVELYLKVIAQITTLYKAETSSMLFGADESS